MFDGAELSAVYGTPSYERTPSVTQQGASQPMSHPTQQPQQLAGNPHIADANAYGKATTSHATPAEVSYSPPNAMYAQQLPHPRSYSSEDGFWDKVGKKKMEVIKMFILSLVIVLGLSLDRVAGHYLDNYISKSILTQLQEVMVRISYPVGILLVIWIIKASM